MFNRLSIRLQLLGAMCLVTVFGAGLYALITLDERRDGIISEADGKLLVGANAVRAKLGEAYHSRIVGPESVSREEFERIVARHDDLCLRSGLQYLWSVMVLDGRIVFTSATHSVLTNPNSDCATFLEEHTDPHVYSLALSTMRPQYSTFNNKWGKGRMLLLPEYDAHQRPHIWAASVRLDDLEHALAWTLWEALIIIGSITVVSLTVSWMLARSMSAPLVSLTEGARRMADGDLDVEFKPGGSRELSMLGELLNRMRAAIRAQLTALRQEVVVRREAEQRLRESERHFAGLAERNQRLVQEVEHRVRNNLAGLISLVGLMKTNSRNIGAFATAIESRLRAMAHVQRLLVESEWGQVGLRDLITSTIEAMRPLAHFENPVDIDGPVVSLLPEQVTPLTLVLVEWFTNSTKYGAHSTPRGRLRIQWEVHLQAQEPNVRLTWQERGGPRIDRPTTPSLGTDIVYGFVTRELRGQCWIQYPPEGADHAIEFPCLLTPLPHSAPATKGAAN